MGSETISQTGLDEVEFAALLTFAHALADRSGRVLLPYFRALESVEDKSNCGNFDPVTSADRAAEKVIRAAIEERYPAHSLVGEEFGRTRQANDESDYCWIVDPIDGTRSFITGVPLWGTLIGLNYEGEPVLGIMNQPFTGERYWNDLVSAQYRGPEGAKRLTTRRCRKLGEATLLSTAPEMFEESDARERFEVLSQRVRLRRFGTDCYGYCMLASGHADLVVETGLQIFDIAPLIPIIERAGGRVTDWEGRAVREGGRVVAAGDPALHEATLAILSG